MLKCYSKGALITALVVGLAGISLALFLLLRPSPPAPQLPNPNGYDDFLEAGKSLKGDFANYKELTEPELSELVERNQAPLKLVRSGLKLECKVPLDYSVVSHRVERLGDLKKAALALCAEARLRKLQQRPGEAAQAAITAVRMGEAASRGGVIIDGLVGCAIEQMGIKSLASVVPKLDGASCARTAAALEEADAARVTPHSVLEQEKAWCRRTFGFKGQLIRLATSKSLQATQRGFETKCQAGQAEVRKAMVECASRAYELEKKERPKNPGDLVPGYLKRIPEDPFTGKPLPLPLSSISP